MRIKFKLFTDDQGQPQVKIGNPDMPVVQHYWRTDGQQSFKDGLNSLLEVMARDPDSPICKLGEGRYGISKF